MRGWKLRLSRAVKHQGQGQSKGTTFRRILLLRILLLSIPILLMGQYVTSRKARSSLLETARLNLTESAQRKGETIQLAIAAQSATLETATDARIWQSNNLTQYQAYLQTLVERLPLNTQCVQVLDVQTQEVLASTCGSEAIAFIQKEFLISSNQPSSNSRVWIQPRVPTKPLHGADRFNWEERLHLQFQAPIFNQVGTVQSVLVVNGLLPLQEVIERPKSLVGNTIIISDDGQYLVHPDANRVGHNIAEESQREIRFRLEALLRNAISGKQDFLHLPNFNPQTLTQPNPSALPLDSVLAPIKLTHQEGELLAGYTAINSPISSSSQQQKWAILAITRLDQALFGLKEIELTLIQLILGLIVANILVALYIARDLARPMEQLGEYATNVEGHSQRAAIPKNFKIREFNQLAQALNSMIERLTAWAQELESAWREAKMANQLKSEFLANTSHELRTPLNAIIGCIRLVKDDCCDSPEEAQEFLERADQAAVHLLQIINDVLDIAKIEAGALSVLLEPVDIHKLLKDVIDIQLVHIHNKGLQLYYEALSEQGSQELEKTVIVEADPAKLKQVLINVIGNAVKFTELGSITIKTELESVSLNGNGSSPQTETLVVISVQDTGIGVDIAQQTKLFQPFVMADGTRTRRFEGTGLGLAISRNLVELMHGSIHLYSEGEGSGTTIKIKIPLWEKKTTSESNVDSGNVASTSL